MFLTDCICCDLRELRGPRAVELIVNTASGPQAVYRCTRCDAVNVLAGSMAAERPGVQAA